METTRIFHLNSLLKSRLLFTRGATPVLTVASPESVSIFSYCILINYGNTYCFIVSFLDSGTGADTDNTPVIILAVCLSLLAIGFVIFACYMIWKLRTQQPKSSSDYEMPLQNIQVLYFCASKFVSKSTSFYLKDYNGCEHVPTGRYPIGAKGCIKDALAYSVDPARTPHLI